MFINSISKLFGQTKTPHGHTCKLTMDTLENREVPAYLSGGNLEIVGSNAVDTVKVQDVTVSGFAKIRVTHNGVVQDFNASSVYNKVRFWGYGSNDRFDYYGGKSCYADGGSGNDFISTDRGNDLLVGGTGDDTLEGWGGNDELQGGDNNDVLAGGAGNDRLFGQAGSDTLGGESGNDSLIGGTGLDFAFGGSGTDQFWECRDVGFLFIPVNTRFGTASSYGVQDFASGERIWS